MTRQLPCSSFRWAPSLRDRTKRSANTVSLARHHPPIRVTYCSHSCQRHGEEPSDASGEGSRQCRDDLCVRTFITTPGGGEMPRGRERVCLQRGQQGLPRGGRVPTSVIMYALVFRTVFGAVRVTALARTAASYAVVTLSLFSFVTCCRQYTWPDVNVHREASRVAT